MERVDFLAASAGALLSISQPKGFGPQQVLPQSNIAVSLPLSGPLATYGNRILIGVRAAIDETNRFNATITRAWGLRPLDDQNNAAVATSNAFVAAADPSVVAVIGNLTIDTTLAALPQYQNASFACIVPGLTADVITAKGYHNVFRLPTKDSTEGQLFARATLGRKGSVVRAIAVDGEYGVDTARGFVQQAKVDKHDADVLLALPANDPANVAARALKDAPAFIFLAGKPDKLGPVARAIRAQGYQGDIGCSDGFFTTSIIDAYGEVLNGALVASSIAPLERVPSIYSLLQDFRGEAGDIDAFSAYGYAAAQLIIAAAGRATTVTRFALLSQLQSGGTYNLLTGQYSFTYSGDALQPNIYLYRITTKGFNYVRSAVPNGFVV